MQKSANIKYALYKVTFAAVLCAFFFVQTQVAFIACAYNDFAQSGQSHFLHDGHNAPTVDKAAGFETHPKYKLNRRYQPVTSPALLPYTALEPVYFTVVSHEWVARSCHETNRFLFCKPLRGPPFV